MALWSRFFGSAVSTAAGVSVGAAVSPTLNPLTQALANDTWALYPDVPVNAILLAQGVAQKQVDRAAALTWASHQGFGESQFEAMVAVFDTGPGAATAFELRRRGFISDAEFVTALKREGIEDQWISPLRSLLRRLLSPAELANAVVQGHRSFADALADAELQGYTQADFQTMVDNTGLPPGVETMVEWRRRGVMTDAELDQGILESHTKPKYIPFYHAALHPVLSAAEYAGLRLRGWLSKAESDTGGALTGYTPEQMQLLFLNRGRPATPRQIRIGYARGGAIIGGRLTVEQAIAKAVRESDIRPEYEEIESQASWSYPSPFVVRGLTQAGAFTAAQSEQILLEMGWKPQYAHLAAQFFAGGATDGGKAETKAELRDEYEGGYISEAEFRSALEALGYQGATLEHEISLGAARRIKRWREKAVDAIAKAYIGHDLDEATARVRLAEARVSGEAADLLFPLWQIEQEVARKHLTAAQVKRAYRRNILTLDQATQALVGLNYTTADAAVYLAS